MSETALPRPRGGWCIEEDSLWMLPFAPVFLMTLDADPDLASAAIRASAVLLLGFAAWAGRTTRSPKWGLALWAGAWLAAGAAFLSARSDGSWGWLPVAAAAYVVVGSIALGWIVTRSPGAARRPAASERRRPSRWILSGIWLACGGIVLALLSAPPARWLDAITLLVAVGAYVFLSAGDGPANGGSPDA